MKNGKSGPKPGGKNGKSGGKNGGKNGKDGGKNGGKNGKDGGKNGGKKGGKNGAKVVTDPDAGEAMLVPLALVAVTVYVWEVSAVSAIVIGDEAPVPEVPSEPVTVKLLIALPPVAGAVKAIEFWLTPAVGVGADIVAGTVVAVIEFDAVDA
jgi:hypothetical protein